ncbi:MAG TPA: DNA-binding protein [Pseudolysinimonas sp.]|nr:DNA-binding protein [Pseudolysinimonas sp.]
MFAITADQVGSRAAADLADAQLARIEQIAAGRLVLPPDRTAGDEIQAATEDARAALDLVLDLTRDGNWSVGLGVGDVRLPLPDATRAATGSAFILARDAVARAKKNATRFAVSVGTGRLPDAALLQPLIDLLLHLRARRTPEGWEVADRLVAGMTQARLAAELGVTPQAISLRVQNAQLHTETAAIAALTELLAAAGEPPVDHKGETS